MFKFIKKNIIKHNISIENAINKMELSEKKILLVISKKNKFIGTVTDGDFRRFFLIKNRNLKSSISTIANKNSIFLRNSEILKKNKIKNLFLKKLINYIPVLNYRNSPIGILDRDDYIGFENKNNLPIK